MARAAFGPLLRYLRRLSDIPAAAEATDRHLLQRYVVGREEAAFETLVRRHAPLVWGVCRRVLDEHEAEDAFQAAFLVLVRKAGSLQAEESLANWLHAVAYRVAMKAKVTTVRRRIREGRAEPPQPSDPFAAIEWRDLRRALDEELDRLPRKYRAPLVLCYLEGKTYAEAARCLGWTDGTVCGRLARARELLRQRLLQRGMTLSGAALVALLTPAAIAPAASVAAVVRTATLFALGQSAVEVAPSSVTALAQGILHTMTVAKVKTIVALVMMLGVLASGAGWAAHRSLTATEAPPAAASKPEPPRGEKREHTDRRGDPLPAEAIARLGTTRFRHGYNVFDIAFSPDGKQLVSADWFGAHLWEAATGREIHRIGPRFNTSLRSLSLSADGKIVALAEHHQGMIQIRDVASGKLLRQFRNGPDNDDRFCSVVFSPDGKILASVAGKIIRLWDAVAGKELRQWKADPENIHNIVFSPDGKTLISGGDDRTIRFWDTSTGKEVRRIADHPGMVSRIALSPDGKVLASLGATREESKGATSSTIMWLPDNKVHLWDVATGKKLRQLEAVGPEKKKAAVLGHPHAISYMVFAPDGKTLVTAGHDRTLRFWDVSAGKELRRWDVLWLTSLAFSPDGKALATGSIDATVRLWDLASGRELREQAGHRGDVRFLTFSPDGRRIATASIDRTVRIWDAANGRELHRLRGPEGEMRPVAFSADGRTLTTVGGALTVDGADKKGRVWDVATGEERRQLPVLTEYTDCAVSPDGRTYALVAGYKSVVLWDVATERKCATRIEHEKGIVWLAFSPDNRSLFMCCNDCKVHVWDIAANKELRQFALGDEKDTQTVAFSPDGRRVACAGREGVIRVYDLVTGKEVRCITGPSSFLSCLAFAPDGRTLAAGGDYDPTIRLWEVASGQLRHELVGHQGRIFTLVFSADGKRLASSSADTTALLWDLTGEHAERTPLPSSAERSARWNDLASTDARTAYRALQILAATPSPTVSFLEKQLQPIPSPDAKQVALLITDLDGENFAAREKAAEKLRNLGSAIEPSLRAALTDSVSAETRRRIEGLLAKLELDKRTPSAARLQVLRAIEILERIGDAEARQVLRTLAKGAPPAWRTREATAALERLARRSAATP